MNMTLIPFFMMILLSHSNTWAGFIDCNFPGISPWSIVTIKEINGTSKTLKYYDILVNNLKINDTYRSGSTAKYRCEYPGRYVLQNQTMENRTCRENGKWNNAIPFCVENIAHGATICIPADNCSNESDCIPGIQDISWLTDGLIKNDTNKKRINKWPNQCIEIKSQFPPNFTYVVNFTKKAPPRVDKYFELHIGNRSCPVKDHHNDSVVFRCENTSNSTDKLLFYHYHNGLEILEIQVINDSVELLDELKRCQIPEFHFSQTAMNHANQSWNSSTCLQLANPAKTQEVVDESKTSTSESTPEIHPTISQSVTEQSTETTKVHPEPPVGPTSTSILMGIKEIIEIIAIILAIIIGIIIGIIIEAVTGIGAHFLHRMCKKQPDLDSQIHNQQKINHSQNNLDSSISDSQSLLEPLSQETISSSEHLEDEKTPCLHENEPLDLTDSSTPYVSAP